MERSTYAVDTSCIYFIRGNVTGTSHVRGTYVARTKFDSDLVVSKLSQIRERYTAGT